MKRPALVGVCAIVAACGGNKPAPAESPWSATTEAAPKPPASPPKPEPTESAFSKALMTKLRAQPVEGYVVFDLRAKLHPSADGARASASIPWSPRPSHGALQVLADEGDVLHVTTQTHRRDKQRSVPTPATIDRAFVIEGWIAKRALLPVLRRPLVRTFDDGSGYALRRGAPLVLLERPHVIESVEIPADIDEADVALSFEPEDARLDSLSGSTVLGCKSVDGATRVDARARLVTEDPPKGGAPFGGFSQFAALCRLRGKASIGGLEWAPRDPCSDVSRPERTERTAAGQVFVELRLPSATVRARTSESDLDVGGGCGRGMAGLAPRSVLRATSKTTVWFADGTRAGAVTAQNVSVSKQSEANGRPCTTRPYLAVPICFDRSDVVEAEGSPLSDER